MNINITPLGKVILAGAGPGDPELITLKALRYLQKADVVITDRLVSEELLTQHVKPGARVIHVGKQAGQLASTPQEEINSLLVEHARRSPLVVRLKGGDVTFFANMLDELKTLVEHRIPYEIVPGVTAASGAAAYAGIPLTARGYASAVRFLTYYRAVVWDESCWKDLASTDDTLVFYMSADVLDTLVEKLLDNRISSDKYLAVIEQATTPSQRVHLFNLCEYEEKMRGTKFASPTLIIIGRVAAFHEEFKWIENTRTHEEYFKPARLTEKRLSVVC
jgi:uroporphyrin-III C-methyltransferase/precorrin-2 dehydrogenase/sirohydrochlorin ferrochelatase/uroporphyrin-III C-methyltransferase